jgi:hypothetical protein
MADFSNLWDWISTDGAPAKASGGNPLYAALPAEARDQVRQQGMLGLAAGLLSDGGWSPVRRGLGTGLAAGLQNMQAGERAAMGQYLAGQAARAHDLQDKTTQIGMAQTLGQQNALRAAFGGRPITLGDINDPNQFQTLLTSLSNPMADGTAQASAPGPSYGGPIAPSDPAQPGAATMAARMNVGGAAPMGPGAPGAALLPAGGGGQVAAPAQRTGGGVGPYGGTWRDLYEQGYKLLRAGIPQYMTQGREMMKLAVENDPTVVAGVAQGKAGLVPDGRGGFTWQPGGIGDPGYQRSMEFAKAGGKSQGELPAELAKIGATGNQARQTAGYTENVKAGLDPYTYQVPDGNGGYITINTTRAGYQQSIGNGGTGSVPGKAEMGEVDKAMLPDLIKGVTSRQDAGRGANDALAATGELRAALNGLPTGGVGTSLTNEAAATFSRLGLDINAFLPPGYATDPTKYQIAAKNFNNLGMALARANFPGGRITNADLEMAIRATPNFWNNPEANKELLDNIEAINRLKVERATFDRRWLMNNGNRPSLRMEDDWNNHVAGLKGVPDVIKQGFQGYTDAAGSPTNAKAPEIKLPSGAINFARGPKGELAYQFRNPDGALYWGDAQGAPMRW